jgi:hypothetical protein
MMKNLLSRFPFFLLLLPLFVAVHIEKELPGLVIYKFVYDHLIFMFLVPFVFFLFFYLFSRSVKKAALQTFTALLFFYFFGEIKTKIETWAHRSIWQNYSLLMPLFGIPVLLIIYKVYKSKSAFSRIFLYINTALILFIAADLCILFINKKKYNRTWNDLAENYQPCDSCVKPDIYYLIFDSYASSVELKEDFGYANTAIEDSLRSKGFKLIPNSRSNYNMTIFSIGSVFNLDYVPDADSSKTYYLRDLLPATKNVYKNQLIPLLEKENYQIFNHSIFNIESYPATTPVYDIFDIRGLYREYNFVFKAFTEMGYHLPPRIRFFFNEEEFHVKARQRDHLDSAIFWQTVSTSLYQKEKPKFVYAHFSIPHPPYTYDSLGNQIPAYPWGTHLQWKDSYVQQTVYSNKVMLRLVDFIQGNASRPTVIIIQGDHGFRFFEKKYNQKEFLNFNAVYFSNGNYRQFTDSTTNVNTFRIVLNTFFKKEYPLLDDRTYFMRFKLF